MTTTWLTRPEAAAYLRIHVDTLDRYARDKKITRYTVAGTRSVRFKVTELDNLVRPAEEEAPDTTDQAA